MRGAVLATVLALLAECGCSSGATAQTPSPSPTPTSSSAVFPSPSPGRPTPPPPVFAKCTFPIPADHELALVSLDNSAGVAVRDISDISNAATLCVINGGSFFRFLNATHVSYIVTATNGQGGLYEFDLQTNTTSLVRAWSNEGSLYWVYAWSPDGNTLTYLSSDSAEVAWHMLSAAGDVELSRLGSIPGRGVDPNNDDAMVGFSADGDYVALEETFTKNGSATGQVAPLQVIRLADNQRVYSRTEGTMATWSGSEASLYYRTSSGVEVWDPTNGAHLAVPGLSWIHPWPSADGLRIAYTTADANGNHFPGYIRLDDQPPTGIPLSNLPRAGAAFFDSTLVWYAQESVCGGAVQCDLGGPPRSGRAFLHDLVTGTENSTIDTAFFDSWPHVGAS